jgi:hypothetical protein
MSLADADELESREVIETLEPPVLKPTVYAPAAPDSFVVATRTARTRLR